MREGVLLYILAFIFCLEIKAQIGGKNGLMFVNVPTNAHVAGIGGVNVSVRDINMVYQNPSLLSDTMDRSFSFNYVPYFADINRASILYIHNFGINKLGPIAFGLDYFNYGNMVETDEAGTVIGEFKPRDYVLFAGTSHTKDNFTLGVNAKLVGSQLGPYNAFAFLTDLGGLFKHPERDFTIGLTFKNVGFAFKKYTRNTELNTPFDVQIGTSYKLEHMPFRVSITAHHLHQFDIVYLDPDKKGQLDANGVEIKPKKTVGDKIIRHFVLGGEFLLGKHLAIRFGYNFLRRRELRIENMAGAAGMSIGAMVKIKSFELGFTRAWYSTAGATNFLTINSNFNTLFKRKS